ncbi:MAG TPA: IPT/TIG domain-containing protein, partial [Candidatus Limnocylindria bacterium]
MRKFVVAATAAALAVSMLATAIPAAAAVSGYDSSYAGESAFVALGPGQSNTFQVFFANTGTTTWTVGGASQVDLAACLDDKVTCNAQDATEAPWNPGSWLSSTRYATSTQSSVAPGSVATFQYTVTAPAGVAAGTYHFNGALVLHSTGADIHNEGYFQDATVGAGGGAATITSLTPTAGTSNGGTAVTIAGSGFVCTPSFPTVNFGTSTAAVTSCGATSLTATSPAGAVGTVNVTVTNAGAAASNGLPYTYQDTTRPTFQSFTVSNNIVTVTMSEPVCHPTAANTAGTDWSVLNISAQANDTATGDSLPQCTAARDNAVSSFIVALNTPIPNGAFTEATLNSTAAGINGNIVDTSG